MSFGIVRLFPVNTGGDGVFFPVSEPVSAHLCINAVELQ